MIGLMDTKEDVFISQKDISRRQNSLVFENGLQLINYSRKVNFAIRFDKLLTNFYAEKFYPPIK